MKKVLLLENSLRFILRVVSNYHGFKIFRFLIIQSSCVQILGSPPFGAAFWGAIPHFCVDFRANLRIFPTFSQIFPTFLPAVPNFVRRFPGESPDLDSGELKKTVPQTLSNGRALTLDRVSPRNHQKIGLGALENPSMATRFPGSMRFLES